MQHDPESLREKKLNTLILLDAVDRQPLGLGEDDFFLDQSFLVKVSIISRFTNAINFQTFQQPHRLVFMIMHGWLIQIEILMLNFTTVFRDLVNRIYDFGENA